MHVRHRITGSIAVYVLSSILIALVPIFLSPYTGVYIVLGIQYYYNVLTMI